MKSVGIYTLGCKVNTYESEFVENELIKAGYEIKNFDDICDVYIINTCTVTNNSDSKSRKTIRQAIKRNPNACVVAMGCFVAVNKDYHENGLDIVLGNKDKANIVSLLDEYFKNKETIVRTYDSRLSEFEDMRITEFPGRTRAFVKIQDGCDNFCSYCIIPFARGKCRSKKEDDVVEEVTDLVNNGYKEVVLTGIHTGAYGTDLDTSFADLLNRLVKIDGLKRLRISSIETTELNEDVLNERISFVNNRDINERVNLCTVAAVYVRYKGQQYVIQALGRLKKTGDSRFHYYMIGAGDQTYLRNMAKRCGVEDQVHLS